MKPDEIMTVEEVAKYLKLKPQTIYKWAQTGQIPAAKFGKEWRFRRRILDEWIDASIAMSKGGFDLLQWQTELARKREAQPPTDEVEDVLRKVRSD